MRTARLLLSRPTAEDLPAIHELRADPSASTSLTESRHVAWNRTAELFEHWQHGWETRGTGMHVVRRRGSVHVLGSVGCSIRDDVLWDLSYRLSPGARGQGFAIEAAAAVLAQAQERHADLPVTAVVPGHDHAAAAVASRIGLAMVGSGPDAADHLGIHNDGRAVRLVYSDRALSERELSTALS